MLTGRIAVEAKLLVLNDLHSCAVNVVKGSRGHPSPLIHPGEEAVTLQRAARAQFFPDLSCQLGPKKSLTPV